MYTLFITRGYPTDKYKLNGIFEFDQAQALAAQGIKVVYLAIDLRSLLRSRKWGVEQKVINGVNVMAINLPIGGVSKSLLARISELALMYLYNKVEKEYGRPDIIHAHFTTYGYIAIKLKDKLNVPLVITEHSSHINTNPINKDIYKLAKCAYNGSDSLIAVSPSLSKTIYDKFSKKSLYIPNIVDVETFKYEIKQDSEFFTFTSTGNLNDVKRMDLLIKAFAIAFKDINNVRLTIFGDGPNKQDLENLISNLDLENVVNLMGLCSRQAIANHLQKSDCFVLASKSETFGVAFIEALAVGVPVISTKSGGPEIFINKNNGLLVDLNNVNQLAASMKFMYNNVGNYNRKEISKLTHNNYGAKHVADKIINEYQKVLKDNV